MHFCRFDFFLCKYARVNVGNEVLQLIETSHVTCNIQSEFFILVQVAACKNLFYDIDFVSNGMHRV